MLNSTEIYLQYMYLFTKIRWHNKVLIKYGSLFIICEYCYQSSLLIKIVWGVSFGVVLTCLLISEV